MKVLDDNLLQNELENLKKELIDLSEEKNNYMENMISQMSHLNEKKKKLNETYRDVTIENNKLELEILNDETKITKLNHESKIRLKEKSNEKKRILDEHKRNKQKKLNEMELNYLKIAELERNQNLNDIKFNYKEQKYKMLDDNSSKKIEIERKKLAFQNKKNKLDLEYFDKLMELEKQLNEIKLDELKIDNDEKLNLQNLLYEKKKKLKKSKI